MRPWPLRQSQGLLYRQPVPDTIEVCLIGGAPMTAHRFDARELLSLVICAGLSHLIRACACQCFLDSPAVSYATAICRVRDIPCPAHGSDAFELVSQMVSTRNSLRHLLPPLRRYVQDATGTKYRAADFSWCDLSIVCSGLERWKIPSE